MTASDEVLDALPVPPALHDLTVLELSQGISGAWCGKLLAGLGARVIKVEPPAGELGRRIGPFKGDAPDPEKSGTFLYLNTAKQSVVHDLSTETDRQACLRLTSTADVLIESFAPGESATLGLDYQALSALNQRLIVVSITPFGQDGPYSDFVPTANEIVAEALGGLMSTIGLPEREPLKIGGSTALYNAGGAAFSAVLAAIWQRDRSGAGQYIDISIQEATALTQIHSSIEASWLGTNAERRPSSLLEARDGWASVGLEMGVSADTWSSVCAMLGRPELATDPRFTTSAARRDNREALQAIVHDWVRGQAKEEIYHVLQSLRSIAGYVATAADLQRSAQLRSRNWFTELDHPVAGTAVYPGPPFRVGGSEWVTARAPLQGEHTREVSNEWSVVSGGSTPLIRKQAIHHSLRTTHSPLSGVRILDLTQVAVGPYATLLLAGLGAEVIKVESNRRPDITRGPVQPAGETQLKQYPGGVPGERPWNRGAFFNQRNRNKLGITLDLSDPRGKAVFKQLVACCDVLAENFRASVLERQGLGWEELRRVNPRLVYLKLSSQGNSGPERDYGSLGSTLEQTAGLVSITGYRDGPPLMTNETFPDPVAGIVSVGALIAGLRQAARTGEGQFIDCSQRELTIATLGEMLMDYALNGRIQQPIGNRHPRFAPQGVYPCRGDDAWIAISVETDAQWLLLCGAMGDPVLAAAVRFKTADGRMAGHDQIDAAIAAFTVGKDKHDLMQLLQQRGVPAGAVLSGLDLLANPQLNARGWWETLTPPEVGTPHKFISPPWRMSANPPRPSTPAPLLGEHNDHVYRDLLGLSRADYTALQAAGVVSTEPLWVRV
ncbi:MAG: CaiB/BaiF CoA transferase family protein [Dehalococcoidia bacterium]